MRLVQTLVVRDEADIVESQITHHLNAGVDFVIATDHDSKDGTTEILERFVREGCLLRIPETGENREAVWRTQMARLAATEYAADWVINTDADEFWMPRGGTLETVLAAVPARFGVVWALSRHFPPRPDDGRSFEERMIVRVAPPLPINDPTSPYRPHAKAAHRADPEIVVRHGAHGAYSKRFRALRDWYVGEVFHFPFRSLEQWERKGVRRARADKPLGQYVKALRAHERGRSQAEYRSLVVDDESLERGLAAGSLAIDTRLRDVVHGGVPNATPDEASAHLDGSLVREAAGLQEADVVRLFRHLDGLGVRVGALEDS